MALEGCGLKEVFTTVYEELSSEKDLNGHAFRRSIIGHLIQNMILQIPIKIFLHDTLKQIKNSMYHVNFKSKEFSNIKKKFTDTIKTLKNKGPTVLSAVF